MVSRPPLQLGFHQAQQLKGAAGQVVTVVDAHRAALHAPPVVDGLAGVGVVPAAIEDGADDLDIKDIPAPLRQATGWMVPSGSRWQRP